MPPPSNPRELGARLAAEGPFKHEPANRRVRGLMSDKFIFDTLEAEYVWEHQYYPLFFIPLKALQAGPGEITRDDEANREDQQGHWFAVLTVGDRKIRLIVFEGGELDGLVKISIGYLDAWFVEDEKLLGPHPKDPYKRIECLPSTREIRVEVDGQIVARSTSNVFLFETMLRTRYYLPQTSILDWGMLRDSGTRSFCPYKGEARYYHLKVGDREIEDAIWYYTYPTAESAAVQGRLCFYNEKVHIFVDGAKEDN